MPYLGVKLITKATKLERFPAGNKRQFVVNGKGTPDEYRAKSGLFRVVFIPFDEKTKKFGELFVLTTFRISGQQ